MKFSVLLCWTAVVAASLALEASAVTVQTAAHVFESRPYLWVEAESVSTINGTPGYTWKVISKGGPEVSVTAGTPVPIMPSTTNASGAALWAPVNDFSANHSATAIYQLRFITAGTYQFYLRQSLYDSNNNVNFLNEDSIYLPPEFNKNSGTDWLGFAGLSFDDDDPTVDLPNPGYALDPDGWKPQVGDHDRDGLLELANWGIKSDGVVTFHTPSGTLSTKGHFNWYNRPAYQETTQTGTFGGFNGMKNEFTVTPAMVGEVVTFEVGLREVNVTIDGFMFIQTSNIYPDQDLLDLYSQEDLDAAILPHPGDYNGDGRVDAADYVVWRKIDGSPAGFNTWRTNFGTPLGTGNAIELSSAASVPETSCMAAIMVAAIALSCCRSLCDFRKLKQRKTES